MAFFRDTFTDTDDTPLGSHTSDSGHSWEVSGDGGLDPDALFIESNRLTPNTNVTFTALSLADGFNTPADFEFFYDYYLIDSVADDRILDAGPIFRCDLAELTAYRISYQVSGGSLFVNLVRMHDLTGFSEVVLDTAGPIADDNDIGDVLTTRVTVEGDRIIVTMVSAQRGDFGTVIDHTDVSGPSLSGTRFGAFVNTNVAGDVSAQLDNLTVTDRLASGDLIADEATVSGFARDITPREATGTLQAEDAQVSGFAADLTPRAASGALEADEATASGEAGVLASASGALAAEEASLSGGSEGLPAATGALVPDEPRLSAVVRKVAVIEGLSDRKILTLCEIDYDFCNLTYGTAPCQAVLGTTGEAKCFNTRATCQDPDNYDPGTKVLRFIKSTGFEPKGIEAIPSIAGVSTAPARLRPGEDLGERASVSVTFQDHPYHDRTVDKYAAERVTGDAQDSGEGYNPAKRGTFWGKFRARNPYFQNRGLRIIQGTLAQAGADLSELSHMQTRHYVMESITGPTADGRFTITAKDVLKLADDDRAQAPVASQGTLTADISDSATTLTLSPAGIGDAEYPASGFVTVGNEVIAFTRSDDDLTIERGRHGTAPNSHSEGDTVQLALDYDGERASDIVRDLLVNYAAVPSAFIPLSAWNDEDDEYIDLFYSALIAEPEPVRDLIGQLCTQAGFTLWWNEVDQLIEFRAIRQPSVPPLRLTDDRHILSGSASVKEQPKKRISQVWVFFGIIDPTEDVEEARNYRTIYVDVDGEAESDEQYQSPRIKKIYGRWLPQFSRSAAVGVASRLLSRYRNAPRKIDFGLKWDQAGVSLGNAYDVETRLMQTPDGEAGLRRILITSYQRGEDRVLVETEEFLFESDPEQEIHKVDVTASTTEGWNGPFNLRDEHDRQYPTLSDVVELIVHQNAILGGEDPSVPACYIGDWPVGTTVRVIIHGRIQGAGGRGGRGGDLDQDGSDGQDGGLALYTRYPIELVNEGEIWGGGGGGGGGAGDFVAFDLAVGGGGGGGSGFSVGAGGAGRSAEGNIQSKAGEPGTTESGGDGGDGDATSSADYDGGRGGNPGQSGQDGDDSTGHSGGAGGSAGNAIDGDSFITYTETGDIRGGTVN